MIDLHCHILPGLDDGAPGLENSLRMCRMARDDGITGIVASPHMLNGVYENHPKHVREMVAFLQGKISSEIDGLTIHPGADVHIHENLPELLARGQGAGARERSSTRSPSGWLCWRASA